MNTGVQFTGTLTANQTQRWFTFNWNPAWHVVWYMMPTSTQTVPGGQLDRRGRARRCQQRARTGSPSRT